MSNIVVSFGVISNGLTLTSGSTVSVYGTAISTTLSGGDEVVYSGGTAIGTTVSSGGVEIVSSGGMVTGTTVDGGGDQFLYSGTTTGTTVNSGGTEYVYSGAAATGTTVNDGGAEEVNGGTTVDTTVDSGGSAFVGFGGRARGTVVNSGGAAFVQGSTASDTTVSSGGAAFVEYGGTASDTTVDDGGGELVSSASTASGTVLSSGGYLVVLPHGSQTGTMSSGGAVVSGGVVLWQPASGFTVYGDVASGATVGSGATEYILSHGTAVSATVSAKGNDDVFSGGTASATVLNSGGYESVSGTAVSTTVNSSGVQYVYSSGTASDTTVNGGGIESVQYGTAIGTTVNNGGVQEVMYAATATATTVNGGGTAYVEYATAFSTTVNSGGVENVFYGGTASGNTVDGGTVSVSDGRAIDTTVSSGGSEDVGPGGVASFTTVSSGGYEYVSSGGRASFTMLSSGGTANVAIGGSAVSTMVSAFGIERVSSGGTAISTTLAFRGVEVLFAGGTASDTTVSRGARELVSAGGIASFATVDSGGYQYVSNGGTAIGTTVNSGGTEVVSSGGGTTSLTTLEPGGTIDVVNFPFAAGGSAGVNSMTDVLTVSVGGQIYTQPLAGDYAQESFQVAKDTTGGTFVIARVAAITASWLSPVAADWNVAADWSTEAAPDSSATDVLISQSGVYTVSIAAGESFSAGAVTLAGESGATGALAVTGAGSELTASGGMDAGDAGTGSLLIENQATVATGGGPVVVGFDAGVQAGASGAVTVSGTGSLLDNTGEFVVGDSGPGSLSILAGGTVTTSPGVAPAAAIVANAASANGSFADVSGAGSNWQITGLLDVGISGFGALSVSEGATVTAGTLDAGIIASSVANISVTDANFLASGNATVADDGTGVLSVLAGATFSAASLTIGNTGDGSGAVFVSGPGSVVNISGDLNVGTALGTGDLTIGPGAVVDASVVNLRGQVVLENGDLDPTVNLINQGQTAGGSGTIAAGDVVDDGVIQAGGSKPSQQQLVVSGTVPGGGPWTINGTAQAQANGDAGVLQINAGGTLELTGPVLNTASTTFTDDLTPPSTYTVNDSVVEVNFEDATGVLLLNDIGGFSGTIAAFRQGDEFVITGGTLSGLGVSNGNTLTVGDTGNGGVDSLIFASSVSAAGFSIVNTNTIQVACFVPGTRIATANGPVAVEVLRIGDRVVTNGGRDEPIVWIGQRAVNCRAHPKSEAVWPVRVRAGAFGENIPVRDLYLSPDHAVFVNGALVPVKLLVNRTSIAQVKRDRVSYFHVELPRHAVILAEGLTVESYLDTGDRANFRSDGAMIRLFPDFGARLAPYAALVWETRGAAPLVMTGVVLEAARAAVGANVRQNRDPRRMAYRTG